MVPETISERQLTEFVTKCLVTLGFTTEQADLAAQVVVEADVRGVDSHGTRLLGTVAERLKTGEIVAAAEPELIVEQGAGALFDGHHGYGPYLCARVLDKAISLAGDYGIGWVSLKNSSHWGCPGYYPRYMAKRGFIGIAMTNTNPSMPLWGSSEKSVGNNPLVIAAPRLEAEPIVLDIAMQQVAWGKLRIYDEFGEKLPELWGYDSEGELTDDPGEIIESGRPRPMGDYKGSGLAVMLEILTGILNTSLTSTEMKNSPIHYSQTFLALKANHFMPLEGYFDKIEAFYGRAKQAPLAKGFSEILLPGDRSNASMRQRRENGIPTKTMARALVTLSDMCGIPVPGEG